MSSIIDKMCKLLGMKRLQNTPYHPQTNGLVKSSHQTIMWMIRELGEDNKADWPRHMAEIVHAYNATQCAMTGYSPHYLMFGCRPRFQVGLTSPSLGVQRSPREVPPPSMWMNMWLLSKTD